MMTFLGTALVHSFSLLFTDYFRSKLVANSSTLILQYTSFSYRLYSLSTQQRAFEHQLRFSADMYVPTKHQLLVGIISTSTVIFASTDFDKPIDKSKWVDPTDMVNFEHATGKYRDVDETVDSKQQCTSSALPAACICPENRQMTATFLKHFVRDLTGRFGSNEWNDVVLELSLTPVDVKILRLFVADTVEDGTEAQKKAIGQAQDALEVLQRMVKRARKVEAEVVGGGWQLLDQLTSYLPLLNVVILIPCISVLIYQFVSIRNRWRFIVCLFSVGFFIDVVWTYIHMYKVKEAELRARFVSSVPEQCRPKEMSIFAATAEWLRTLFSFANDDPCVQFQKDVLIDPFWEVHIMEAVSRSLVNIIVSPVDIIGAAISSFLRHLHKDLPLQLQVLALPILFLMVLVVLFFYSSYGIQLLWGIIRIEPVRTQPLPTSQQHPTAIQLEQPQPLDNVHDISPPIRPPTRPAVARAPKLSLPQTCVSAAIVPECSSRCGHATKGGGVGETAGVHFAAKKRSNSLGR